METAEPASAWFGRLPETDTADGAQFEVTGAGVHTFKATKDFVAPDNADTNVAYEVRFPEARP